MSGNYQSAGQYKTDGTEQPQRGYKSGGRSYKEILKNHRKQYGPAAKDLLIDMVAGAAGAALGACMGRISLLAGAGVNFLGHVLETHAISTFGTGMAVVNVIQGDPVVQLTGTEEKTKWEKAKERLLSYKDNLLHKLYLDNVFKKDEEKKTETPQPENKAVGEVKHFVYPYESTLSESKPEAVGEIDFSALDEIETKLADSAKLYQNKSTNAQVVDSMNGTFDPAYIVSDPLY